MSFARRGAGLKPVFQNYRKKVEHKRTSIMEKRYRTNSREVPVIQTNTNIRKQIFKEETLLNPVNNEASIYDGDGKVIGPAWMMKIEDEFPPLLEYCAAWGQDSLECLGWGTNEWDTGDRGGR